MYRVAAATVAAIFTKGEIFPGLIIGVIVAALFFFSMGLLRQEDRKSAIALGHLPAPEAPGEAMAA